MFFLSKSWVYLELILGPNVIFQSVSYPVGADEKSQRRLGSPFQIHKGRHSLP